MANNSAGWVLYLALCLTPASQSNRFGLIKKLPFGEAITLWLGTEDCFISYYHNFPSGLKLKTGCVNLGRVYCDATVCSSVCKYVTVNKMSPN